MEAVTGRSGASPVTPARWTGIDLALLVLVALLLLGSVVGGVLVWQARADRADAIAEQERYGEVLAAARAEAEAFVNIRYDDAQTSIDQVAEGATGAFRARYTASSDRVIEELQESRSVLEGEVLHAGVVDVDEDTATVIAATTGTLASKRTDDRPVRRDLRLRLELVREDGRWLTSDLRAVN